MRIGSRVRFDWDGRTFEGAVVAETIAHYTEYNQPTVSIVDFEGYSSELGDVRTGSTFVIADEFLHYIEEENAHVA